MVLEIPPEGKLLITLTGTPDEGVLVIGAVDTGGVKIGAAVTLVTTGGGVEIPEEVGENGGIVRSLANWRKVSPGLLKGVKGSVRS